MHTHLVRHVAAVDEDNQSPAPHAWVLLCCFKLQRDLCTSITTCSYVVLSVCKQAILGGFPIDEQECFARLQDEPLDAVGGEQPLALYSRPLGVNCAAKFSRHQLVGFTWKADSFDSVWQVG